MSYTKRYRRALPFGGMGLNYAVIGCEKLRSHQLCVHFLD
jgi:hypothetical protein